MLPTMLIPPLRNPLECDVENVLASWLDLSSDSFSNSTQVEEDLNRIASLRHALVQTENETSKAASHLSTYQEYHACLMACQEYMREERNESVQFPWRLEYARQDESVDLAGERANVLWNIACLLSYQASIQEKSDRSGWNQAHGLLQQAASILQHLLEDEDLSSSDTEQQQVTTFWNSFLLAQAQIATYYMALASTKPRHVVLAKLASAALPFLQTASHASTQDETLSQQLVHAQAWKTWITSLAQYHESCVHRQKKQTDMELARLQKAQDAISSCQQVVYSTSANEGMEMLQGEVPKMVKTIGDRLTKVEEQFDGPPATSLRDIRGELLVKTSLQPLPRNLTTLSQPLFQNAPQRQATTTTASSSPHISSSPSSSISPLHQATDRFQSELQRMLQEIHLLAHDKMEDARMTLAEASLPHSLTAYKQQQQHDAGGGNGIPLDVWERMELLQQEELIPSIKRDLWGLRERADFSFALYQEIHKQLEEDLQLDEAFRQEHVHFIGHDTMEVQRSFRTSLARYESLLRKSRTGDATLHEQCTTLDTDPKYKLLQFQKVQLDRLLSSTGISRQDEPIDTTQLARLLVALSSLFDEREELLDQLESKAHDFDIESRLSTIDASAPTAKDDYERVVQESLQSFSEVTFDIRTNISRQVELVDSILQENERFVKAREAGPPPNANENCIHMIEDAIEEAEQLKKHLREGIEFYNVVIPKLEHLQHEVGDASARLAIERCEYEDGARNRSQEDDDARLAASLAERNSNRALNGHGAPPPQTLTDSGEVLDDSKVANLVEMNFDPDRVVAALKAHNNDMDRALNQLLSE